MRRPHSTRLVLPALMILSIFATEATAMSEQMNLNDRRQGIVAIAAHTASGDLDQLATALNEGLDAGLTINEIKEVLTHLYAYVGFPRSLNGMTRFAGVLQERRSKGIEDAVGPEASPVPADLDRDAYGARVRADLSGQQEIPPTAPWQEFAPTLDAFLKQHLFADLFARDVLTRQERELATIGALANLAGAESQLAYHLGAALNTGVTREELRGFVDLLENRVGSRQASLAATLLEKVLESR